MYISISYIFCIVINYLSTWLESDVVAAFYGNYLLWIALINVHQKH